MARCERRRVRIGVVSWFACLSCAIATQSTGFVGKWTLARLFVGPELGEFPLSEYMGDGHVTLTVHERGSGAVQEGPDHYSLQFQVVNNCNHLATSSPSVAGDALFPFSQLDVGLGRCTRMAGPPKLMKVENLISDDVAHVRKWMAHENRLLMVGSDVEMHFVRADQMQKPSQELEHEIFS
eukprot:TRINITY_DN20542_c0_g2_i1.p1 TRINITY_DN20542_c0_g2~~TRINITY_DN20542_c0_g2_i1.p1  ORF type:complete len:181 (+),score=27.21 TRINITY_DN20542_c0_g2_i1:95-637(+)